MGAPAPAPLRRSLFLTFLGISLLPSLLLAWLAYHSLDASLDMWRTPPVEAALEGSLGVARQLLSERQPALEAGLDSLLRGRADPMRPGTLLGTPFHALGHLASAPGAEVRWNLRKGFEALPEALERRLAAIPGDTLVVAGPGHLALLASRASGRWVALVALPDNVRGPLAEIVRAQGFYYELEEVRRLARRGLVVAVGLVVVMLAGLAWVAASVLSRGVTRPLEELATGMDRFSRGEQPSPVSGGAAEVRRLSRSFDSMQAELERSRADLARAERTAAWREVARRIAHEIKNPLTPVRLSTHRLRGLESALPPDARATLRESLDAIEQEVETLRRMADTFSRFSRLPGPELQRVELAPVLRSVKEMYRGSNLRIEDQVQAGLAAFVDEGQLRLSLHNLIQNASDATGGTGHVWLAAREGSSAGVPGVEITVRDDGPGFTEEARTRAGEPYFTSKTHGTGLGLAMVRQVMEGHGGGMEVLSSADGGACIRIWIPRRED